MNKIGIVSDTHDSIDKIEKIIDIFNEKETDLIIHCGDMISPFIVERFNRLNGEFLAVLGNNDGDIMGLKSTLKFKLFNDPHIFKIHGVRFVVTHKPEIVSSLQNGGEFDFIFYGHTHRSDIRIGTPTIINPGEGCGYMTGKATVAVLDIAKNDVELIEVK